VADLVGQLTELDLRYKRVAEEIRFRSLGGPTPKEERAMLALIERARGVRDALELAKGGKLVGGLIIPAETLREWGDG